MRARRLFLAVTALVLAGLTAYMARTWLEAQQGPPTAGATLVEEPDYREILVAARFIDAGSFLETASIRWQRWPDGKVPPTYFTRENDTLEAALGSVTRRPLMQGEPVTSESVLRPSDRGFLAVVLEPGMRAVSIPIDDATGNAGLIIPGDHVDVILTHRISEGPDGEQTRFSETFLRGLRVIAMGGALRTQPGGLEREVRTATLEVTPAQAEKVALASELGRLSLSLHSLVQSDATDQSLQPESATWEDDVSSALSRPVDNTLLLLHGKEREAVRLERD